MNDPVNKSLDDALASLSPDIEPSRNLWPGVAGRLERGVRRPRDRPHPLLFAAAAGIAGACLASALTWAVLHSRPSTTAVPVTAQAPALQEPAVRATGAHAAAFDEPRNPHYVAARDDLEASFRERLTLLDPATRAKIEASLAVIRHAHEDIRKALASDPASPVLEQLWQSTSHDELDLYEHVVRATQPTMTRT
ncbi:MAG: hypothetical protein ABJD53_16795 [Gammaproteobacteria bacterium]